MSALTVYVQIYNCNYLINISGAVAAPWTPVQNVFQCHGAPMPKIPVLFIADRWIGFAENSMIRYRPPLIKECTGDWMSIEFCDELPPEPQQETAKTPQEPAPAKQD